MYHDYTIFCSKLRDQLKASNINYIEEKIILHNSIVSLDMNIREEDQKFRENVLQEIAQHGIKETQIIKQSMEENQKQHKEEVKIQIDGLAEKIDAHYNY